MRKTKPLEKESQTIHKPNQLLNTETTQLLYEKILVMLVMPRVIMFRYLSKTHFK